VRVDDFDRFLRGRLPARRRRRGVRTTPMPTVELAADVGVFGLRGHRPAAAAEGRRLAGCLARAVTETTDDRPVLGRDDRAERDLAAATRATAAGGGAALAAAASWSRRRRRVSKASRMTGPVCSSAGCAVLRGSRAPARQPLVTGVAWTSARDDIFFTRPITPSPHDTSAPPTRRAFGARVLPSTLPPSAKSVFRFAASPTAVSRSPSETASATQPAG